MGPRPYIGGIENVVDTLLRSRLADDFELSVLDTYRAPDPERTTREKAVFAGRLLAEAHRAIRAFRPDLVHIHFCSKTDFWKHALCLLAARTRGIKTVFHLHGGTFDRFYAEQGAIGHVAIRRVFAAADVIVALSERWRDFLQTFEDPARVVVINNPIDCVRLAPRERLPGKSRPPDLLLLGSLGKRKGHFDAVQALPAVLQRFPDARLLFAGGEEDLGARGELERMAAGLQIRDNVVFLGPVGFEQKLELLHRSSALILPSYGENMPISVLEAMAAGTPVIASRVGAVPEALDEGEVGILLDPGDVQRLSGAILSVLEDPERSDQTAHAAQARATSRWDAAQIAMQVGDLYRKVLRRRPPTRLPRPWARFRGR